MASGSGKDPDDHIQEPVHGHGQREQDSDAAPAAATSPAPPSAADVSSSPPPPAPPIERRRGRVREQAGDGGNCSEESSVDRKGKKVAAVRSPTDSSSTGPSPDAAGRRSTSSSPADSGEGVTWRHPVVAGTVEVRKVARQRSVRRSVVLHLERELAEMEAARKRWTEKEEEQQQVKSSQGKRTLWPKIMNYGKLKAMNYSKDKAIDYSNDKVIDYSNDKAIDYSNDKGKRTLWSKAMNYSTDKAMNYSKDKAIDYSNDKVIDYSNYKAIDYSNDKISDRKVSQIRWSHVDDQALPIIAAIRHYFGYGYTATGNVMSLLEGYSAFRPVYGDGECFYRSFIFSYLEQVLDREDTHEEHRLLAAVNRVAMQHAHLGWNSEFTRSHEAFEELINKVMKWKRRGRLSSVAPTNSYSKQKLLEFFSTYDTTEDIFVFLRLVAAIWICSHREEYEPLITGLSVNYALKDWCFHRVTPSRTYADHVQMMALTSALEIPLKVEQLNEGPAQDIYTGPGVPDVRVTLLFTGNHYDIMYPCPPDESSRHQTSPGENPSDESSSQQILLG